jgi:translation initiation factor IF-2
MWSGPALDAYIPPNLVIMQDFVARSALYMMQIAQEKERKARIVEMSSGSAVTLSTLATVDEDMEALQRMNLILKADASGTLEAVKAALQGLPQDSVALRFLLASTGPVQPSDIELARSSSALVVGLLPLSSLAVRPLNSFFG